MNNEKQHSEYKIIETVATPTFDGISVETHPEDLFGGDTPEETLWRYQIQGQNLFGEFLNGNLYIGGPDNEGIFITDSEGKIEDIQDYFPEQLKGILEPYFSEIKNVQVLIVTGLEIGDNIPNWDEYEIINP